MQLHFRQLTLSFRQRTILRDLSLSLHSGHCALLCGDNGSGKSTLLPALMPAHHRPGPPGRTRAACFTLPVVTPKIGSTIPCS